MIMFRLIMLGILNNVWKILIISVLIFILFRIVYFKVTKKKFVFYKEVLLILFLIYLICLFYVVTFEDVEWSTSNYVPFKEITRYRFGSKLFIKNVIGNIIMFAPFGFFIRYFFNIKDKKIMFLIIALTSTGIELLQSDIGRVFDIDDIILNVIGGMVGFLICDLFKDIKVNLPSLLKKNIIYNIIVIVLLVLFIFYLTNVIEVGIL